MILAHPLVRDTLELHTLGPEHASEAYLGWLADPEINRYLEIRFNPPATTGALAEYILAMRDSVGELMLGMFLPGSERHIGNIKLGPINIAHKTADIGLLIGDRAEWGRGHAAVAISMLSDYAFDSLDLCKLTAGCYAPNVGSTKAFLKAGYAEEGIRAGQWLTADGRCDGILLGKQHPDCSAAGRP